ncbi:MAG: hypothetical protein O2919_09450 [Chloroflexi bacterium]|nr:hypothetical protein [Chloroflexota bacterium]
MSTLLRLTLLAVLVIAVYIVVMKPRRIRTIGGKIMTVGYAYVAAILISAFLRLTLGWGT